MTLPPASRWFTLSVVGVRSVSGSVIPIRPTNMTDQSGYVLTSESFAQCWGLDATGNWQNFQEDDTGAGTWSLVQSRAASTVNEITGISNSAGSAWAQPAYDKNGNMTTVPQPANPGSAYTATYDAWNRLVKLVDRPTGNTVQENQYDGRKYRTVLATYTSGTLTETRHYYYSHRWQSLKERLGTSPDTAAAERQFVWGERYIDNLVIRDRDTTGSGGGGSGTLNERLYALQDANWNVTSVLDPTGTMQERYNYAAYGTATFLTPTFGSRSSSSFDWETLYAGYRYDTATGLTVVRHRVYSATLGVWLQRDPIGDFVAGNLYRYTSIAPLAMTDPFGLNPGGILLSGPTLGACLAFPPCDAILGGIIIAGGVVAVSYVVYWAIMFALDALARRTCDRLLTECFDTWRQTCFPWHSNRRSNSSVCNLCYDECIRNNGVWAPFDHSYLGHIACGSFE